MSIRVQVVHALSRASAVVELVMDEHATVGKAALASGLLKVDHVGYAIFGERVDGNRRLSDGDRIELLRALLIDPKEARRRRAAGGA